VATHQQTTKRRKNMTERAEEQRINLFAEISSDELWSRKVNHGWSTIPRTLPIILTLIDLLSPKGRPASDVYFALWCRAPDHPLVVIDNQQKFAAEVGFTGQRAVDTWRKKMKALAELGFIRHKVGDSGEFHYVLLLNPNLALSRLRLQNRVPDLVHNRFVDRMLDIGAGAELDRIRRLVAKKGKVVAPGKKKSKRSGT
jgi:hypothetical protein